MLKLATKFSPDPGTLEQAYRAGFRFAELWLGTEVLANWQTVLEQASAYPNGYVLHFPNRLDLPSDALVQTVALYRHLHCQCIVIHKAMHDKFRGPLLDLEPGLRLAVENHKLSPEDFTRWAERNDGLALDVEHLWMYTLRDSSLDTLLETLGNFLARFKAKLLHVHLPGYLPGYNEHRPMYCAREMIFPVLTLLEEIRFQGLIVSEADLEYQNPSELRMDVLLFEAWRERHGKSLSVDKSL